MVPIGLSASCAYMEGQKQRHHKSTAPTRYLTGAFISRRAGNFRTRQLADEGEEADGCEEANGSNLA